MARAIGGISELTGMAVGAVEVAAREISHGRFRRGMALMAAFAALVSGFEAYMQHQRGAFKHWLMWTPVVLTPPMMLLAGAALFSRAVAALALPWASLVMVVDGLVGFVYHVRGVRRLPGGFRLGWYNVTMGPPLFAPVLLTVVGVLGLLAAFMRPERLNLQGLTGLRRPVRSGALRRRAR
ncbi:MAG TPA: hypothetical protein PLJ35_07525 [Anaerolineae bacterium]|nr:hypothetical protein [Anaerolineae bacterium]HPL30165.1 hypothetical protein [Anaerolineae bacterium]